MTGSPVHDVVGNKPAGDSSDLDWRPLDIVDSEPAPVGSGRDGPGDQSVRFWPTDSDVITRAREVFPNVRYPTPELATTSTVASPGL